MSNANRLPAFEKFIQELRAAWVALPDTEARMKKGRDPLEVHGVLHAGHDAHLATASTMPEPGR